MKNSADVLIVGSGIIGLSTAFLLAKRGLQVTILERGIPGNEASWAGAGIVPPGNLSKTTHPMDRLRAFSSVKIGEWAAEIQSITGIDVGYRRCGGLEMYDHPPTELLQIWRSEEINFEEITSADCRRLYPSIQNELSACHFPTMAQIRNPWYMRGLTAAVEKLGVSIVQHSEVVRFETSESELLAVITQNGTSHSAKRFLLSCGAWSEKLLEKLNIAVPVRPVRGQIVLFQTDRTILHKIVGIGKNYFVPRDDGKILVGATEDSKCGFDKSTKQSDLEHLCAFAYSNIPSLKRSPIEKTWSGLRPGSPGGIPFMGPIPGLRNTFFGGGHYRAGIQLSTGSALALSQMICDESPWLDMSPFQLTRTEPEAYTRPFQS